MAKQRRKGSDYLFEKKKVREGIWKSRQYSDVRYYHIIFKINSTRLNDSNITPDDVCFYCTRYLEPIFGNVSRRSLREVDRLANERKWESNCFSAIYYWENGWYVDLLCHEFWNNEVNIPAE